LAESPMPRAQFAIPTVLFGAALAGLVSRYPTASLVVAGAVGASVILALLCVAVSTAFLAIVAAGGVFVPRLRFSIRSVMLVTAVIATMLAKPSLGVVLIAAVATPIALTFRKRATVRDAAS